MGEVVRRIVGKTISWCITPEILEAAGPLQVSAGMKAGSEAAIHSMKEIFNLEGTDGVILVDAANAFNRLNRSAALHNIQYLCPPFATVLINTYRTPSRLFITGGGELQSVEGTTQGDTLAMQFYGISITPILNTLKQKVAEIYQVWLADDATGAGSLQNLYTWWKLVIVEGKKLGYHVKPTKSWLILKNPTHLDQAKRLFEDSPINITTAGKRHLGAALGSEEFKNEYIDELVDNWCKRLLNLTHIALSQPHVAYAAYIHGEQHKYTHFLRTIFNIDSNLEQIDTILTDKFIPALFGRELTSIERELVALPVKEGGMGIKEVSKCSTVSYQVSKDITAPLVKQIVDQSDFIPSPTDVSKARTTAMEKVRSDEKKRFEEVRDKQSGEIKRSLQQITEPGASSWLGALPLTEYGFNLNKGEFQDALCIRYAKPLNNLPDTCPCGSRFSTTHALNCHKGGFVNARHDNIRNYEAQLLSKVCNDVEIEPPLQKVPSTTRLNAGANRTDEARLDVRARGFYRQGQNNFYDVCVTNADCNSQINSTVKSILRKHEQRKKCDYNRRVIEVEHGTLTPLVFTTSGAMGHECLKFHQSLADKISAKTGERYDEVMQCIRMKISFLAMRGTLLCLRGSRSYKQANNVDDFSLCLRELRV